MCVYLRSKFQVSSIILTSVRQEGRVNLTPPPFPPTPPTAKQTAEERTQ